MSTDTVEPSPSPRVDLQCRAGCFGLGRERHDESRFSDVCRRERSDVERHHVIAVLVVLVERRRPRRRGHESRLEIGPVSDLYRRGLLGPELRFLAADRHGEVQRVRDGVVGIDAQALHELRCVERHRGLRRIDRRIDELPAARRGRVQDEQRARRQRHRARRAAVQQRAAVERRVLRDAIDLQAQLAQLGLDVARVGRALQAASRLHHEPAHALQDLVDRRHGTVGDGERVVRGLNLARAFVEAGDLRRKRLRDRESARIVRG